MEHFGQKKNQNISNKNMPTKLYETIYPVVLCFSFKASSCPPLSFHSHPFTSAGLLSLSLLDLSNNSFSTIPKNLPPSVQQLYLSSNSLSRLDDDSFMGFHNLKYLRLSHCGLQKIRPQVFNVTSLVELDLSYNKLSSIPAVPTTLQYLYLEANQIQGEADLLYPTGKNALI